MQGSKMNKHSHNDKQKIGPPTNWKKIGNEHVAHKRYKDAIIAYTKGMLEGDNSIEMLANRSYAYLRVSNFKCAYVDAELALKIDENHLTSIFRKVQALFGMNLYRNAMSLLENIPLESIRWIDKEAIKKLMIRGERYIVQSEYGDYPWNDLYKKESVYHDMAEYRNSLIVKEASAKGRGLFATKPMKSGELVLASKAFAYVEDNAPNYTRFSLNYIKRCVPEIHIQLIEKVVEKLQILSDYPEQSHVFSSLYAGPELGYLKCEKAASNDFRLDMKRIEHISVYNTISTNRRIDGSFIRGNGLWIIPSFINHNCVDANCSWVVIGDFMFVRAFKNISEGDEILIAYKPPTGLIAQDGLDMYDFICRCRLCERDRLDSGTVKANRITLHSNLETCLEKINDSSSYIGHKRRDDEIECLLKLLDESRKEAPELNLCLVNELVAIGKLYFESGKFVKSAATFEKMFYLTNKVAAFSEATIEACIYIILSFLEVNQIPEAISWMKILKTKTKLYFVTLTFLDIKFSNFVEKIRRYGLDI